jgi:hypothetical protein
MSAQTSSGGTGCRDVTRVSGMNGEGALCSIVHGAEK